MAQQYKLKLILAGFFAYLRDTDYKKFQEIADEVGVMTIVDVLPKLESDGGSPSV